jgi:predicted nucleic-acid-binding Zn-ribbon protein
VATTLSTPTQEIGERKPKRNFASKRLKTCVICGSSELAMDTIVAPPAFRSKVPQIMVDEPGSTMVQLICEECGTAMLFDATRSGLSQERRSGFLP